MLQNGAENAADSSTRHVHVIIVPMPTMRATFETRAWAMINCKQIRCRACNGQGTRNFTANPPPKHLTFLEYQETEVNRRDGRCLFLRAIFLFSHRFALFFYFWFFASLLLCFSAFLLLCFFASLIFCFSAFLFRCLSASPLFQLLCFLLFPAFLLTCFSLLFFCFSYSYCK